MFDKPEIVDRPLIVMNPIGGSTDLSMICCNVVLSSHGCMFVVIALFWALLGLALFWGVDLLQRNRVVLGTYLVMAIVIGVKEAKRLSL